MQNSSSSEHGQAAVELALMLPVVLALILLMVQVAVVMQRQVLVVHAAREGAREAAVDSSTAAITNVVRQHSGLDGSRLSVLITRDKFVGGQARVTVTFSDPTNAPMVGKLLPDIKLQASVAMRTEQ